MSGRGILDADMTTIGGWLRDGLRWWIDELAAMVPPRWRTIGQGGDAASFDGEVLTGAKPGQAMAITLSPDLCLVRTIERPAMGERDLARMLTLDADRVLPLPLGAAVIASRIVAREGGTMRVDVAALPIAKARTLVELIASARIVPRRVLLDRPGGAIDFLPALRDHGLLKRNRGAARAWWAAVAFLFGTNLAMLVWRDSARTAALQEIVDQQRPAVAAARAITGRVRGGQRVAQTVLARRGAHDPLWVLGQVSAALPSGAWVQRFGWQGDSLKIAGYRPRGADVVAALRAEPGFVEVRNANPDTVAEVPAGQPFDVAARVRGPGL